MVIALSYNDLTNGNLGVGLTMALTLTVTLLGLILEDPDLLALAVLDNAGFDLSACYNGSAEGSGFTVDNGQNLVKRYGVAGLYGQLFDKQGITLSYLILLAAGHDNCGHCDCTSFLQYGLALVGVGAACPSRRGYLTLGTQSKRPL